MIIRKLRIEQGFSQEQLAFMAGISVRTLQRIERGAKASPETLKMPRCCSQHRIRRTEKGTRNEC